MFEDKLQELNDSSLLRVVRDRQSPQGREIRIEGKTYLNFSSNDYLGLSAHPYVTAAASETLSAFGTGAGASRLLSGGTVLHGALERRIAAFKGAEAALLFGSGFSANAGAIPALATEGDIILSDERNHASIVDGCRLSKAKTLVYNHRDSNHLESLISSPARGRKIVITDSVFSMDGSIARIPELLELCAKYGAVLYIDDAHATGVLGGGGKGVLSHFGSAPAHWVIQMGTFSKALGSYGGFIAANGDVVQWLKNSAKTFMFSTALPASVVAASIAAVKVVEEDKGLLGRLWENRRLLMDTINGLGFDTGDTETPIVPLILRDVEEAIRISGHLFGRGIYAPAIRPPTVRRPRIRLTVTANHMAEDIERLAQTLKTAH